MDVSQNGDLLTQKIIDEATNKHSTVLHKIQKRFYDVLISGEK